MKPEPAWKSKPEPAVNSRWDRLNYNTTRTCRVMAVVEGWIVARFTGASPFVCHMSDWHLTYAEKIMPKRQRKGIEKPMSQPPTAQ